MAMPKSGRIARYPSLDLVIEPLDPDDASAVAQAAEVLLEGFPQWITTQGEAREEVAEALEDDRVCLVARSGETVLGWVGAIPEYSHAWEIHPLVVRQDARGQGIGRALVTALEQHARAEGVLTLYLGSDDDGPVPGTNAGGIALFPDPLAHAVNLDVTDHPVGFYRRLGFVVVGLIPDANGPGKPDIWMAKQVDPGA
jgi:aminoglycoside 6'-N-acetyltransferase I